MPASSNPQSASSTDIESRPLALVTGVGPGTGAAVARRFAAGGYRVAILARDTARLAALEQEIGGTVALPCDVAEPEALGRVGATLGAPAGVGQDRKRGVWGKGGS